ncbi:unnamed protein product [Meganyctiphanes norvegica]|uniref:Uncharacterized protein n=1 Tax=Meganyctiphanes norvegica TaxID=48144 RepID=A0AAV2Q0T5_MEGNR
MAELAELYKYTPADVDNRQIYHFPEDRLLAELLRRQKKWIVDYHEQDSLLENIENEELSEEERKAAWEEYGKEREEKEMAKISNHQSPPPLIKLENEDEDEVQIIKHHNGNNINKELSSFSIKDQSLQQLTSVYLSDDYHQLNSTFQSQMCGGSFTETRNPFRENISNQLHSIQSSTPNTLESTFYANDFHINSDFYDPLFSSKHSDLMQISHRNMTEFDKNSDNFEQFDLHSHDNQRSFYENDPFRISAIDTIHRERDPWESHSDPLNYNDSTTVKYSPVMSSEYEEDPLRIVDSAYNNDANHLNCDAYSLKSNDYEWISEPNSPVMPSAPFTPGEMNDYEIQNLLIKEHLL